MNSNAAQISSALPWQCDGLTFSFESQTTSRAPRAWDREPKMPFAPTTKGRIVWKRYGLRSTAMGTPQTAPLELGASKAAICPRDVKRLCLKPNYGFQPLVQPRKQTQYLATLQDKGLGTPRRKVTQRENLRRKTLDRSVPAKDTIDSSPVVNEDEVTKTQKQQEEFRQDVTEVSSNDETQQLRLLHSSRHDKESETATSSVDAERSVDVRPLENGTATQMPEEQSFGSGDPLDIINLGEKLSSDVLIREPIPPSEDQKELESVTSENLAISILKIGPSLSASLQTAHGIKTTKQFSELSLESEKHKLSGLYSQQREILHPEDSKSTTTAPDLGDDVLEDTLKTLDTVLSRVHSNVVDQLSEISDEARAIIEHLKGPSQMTAEPLGLVGLIDLSIENRSKGEDKALDPIALQLIPQEQTSPMMQVHASEELGTAESMSPDLHASLPMRRTRSGARFSDDTNMLKDFLNRAHAKKAAKSKEVAIISYDDQSPRRSPRKVLSQLDKNSPSHTNSPDPPCSLNTPPGNDSLSLINGVDDNDEPSGESKLRRRSARTCTTMPEKTTLGPLCFIPVRRPEGSEPVVLQKSAAQELAITTRANTRCNKGLSKLPKIMLETLNTAGVKDAPVKKLEIRPAKSVDWDKNLVYFQKSGDRKVGKEKKEGKAEVRPRAKRLKEPGDFSGIPAPKSVVDKGNPSNGMPAPKRPGKRTSQ
ncbi:hypothetical protein MMC17_002809 [Xylographa soralifera]|nr:hypothetical protein [Xylographa soralifera]